MVDISRRAVLGSAAATLLASGLDLQAQDWGLPPWSATAASNWYTHQPWLQGCNFIPSSAANQLEMWQAETFDARCIDRELGWTAASGMNAIRVFLHDLLWTQDAPGFRRRIDAFLAIASEHRIRVLLVLFDSCWDPFPHLGPQPDPVPGVHNSRWVQSPGAAALQDSSQHRRLRDYVEGVVSAFADDKRVLGWDVWNEPDNLNPLSYGKLEPIRKLDLVLELLSQAFVWARGARPVQPLTSGVWQGDWSTDATLSSIQQVQLSQSDALSFHCYGRPEEFEQRARWLQRYDRPILCTEYMARPLGSTFNQITPVAKRLRVAALNWGLVAGKTQTWLPWDSWNRPYVDVQPREWFHDVFHRDGTPYRPAEIEILRGLATP